MFNEKPGKEGHGLMRKIRFGAFVREMGVRQKAVSYNNLVDASRAEPGEVRARGRVRLRGVDLYRLLRPYISVRFLEQFRSVMPLVAYLVIFQLLILRQDMHDPWVVFSGLAAVVLGLMLFIEGLKLGLMPFGESIGNILPARSLLPVVLLTAMLLGIVVTFAEPAVGALKTAGSIVHAASAPYLYTVLNHRTWMLVLAIGLGVGLAVVVGTIRFLYGWSLKPLIYLTVLPALGLTIHAMGDAELSKLIGLAWDCGAVTTGPVTVPLVLSLGIGIAAAAGRSESSLAGFGIVTLASLFPVIAVLLLGVYVAQGTTPEAIAEAVRGATAALAGAGDTSWYESTPATEILSGLRAIVPLVVFMLVVMKYVLREKIRHIGITTYGLTLCVLGMIMFSLGLSYGLSRLGGETGSLIPSAFVHMEGVVDSPLYVYVVGMVIVLAFGWLLGFGATLAEPALNALGLTVENLTNGAFRKKTLMYAVSIGVGCGIALGVLKIVLAVSLAWFLVPAYALALVLTFFSSEEFVNVAWDSAGVTTGPVTVPLVLAMGLGLGTAVDAVEGFGILSMASIGPILSVLATGLWAQWKLRRRHAELELVPEAAKVGTS